MGILVHFQSNGGSQDPSGKGIGASLMTDDDASKSLWVDSETLRLPDNPLGDLRLARQTRTRAVLEVSVYSLVLFFTRLMAKCCGFHAPPGTFP